MAFQRIIPGLSALILALFISPTLVSAQYCSLPKVSPRDIASTRFDYVIVGGGPGGLTLANRLSEDPNVTVAVLEAGNVHMSDVNISVPAFSTRGLGDPRYNWPYTTVPQPFVGNRSIPIYRGRLLGGSSAINGLAWGRPAAAELDAWDTLNGGKTGWSFADLLPYFIKSETIQNYTSWIPGYDTPEFVPSIPTRPDNGTNGPLKASFNVLLGDQIAPFVESLNAMGIRTSSDPRNGNTTGVWSTLLSVDRDKGVRTEAGMAYCSVYKRKNVKVITGALATKINTQSRNSKNVASGVRFSMNGTQYDVKAKREVIISAGVINTPQLLELSGIGDKKILKKFGIKTVVDLPGVGANFQEHPYTQSTYQLVPGIQTFDILRNTTFVDAQLKDVYNINHTGILAQTNPILTFITTVQLTNRSDAFLSTFDRSVSSLKHDRLQGYTPLSFAQYDIQRQWIANGDVVPDIEFLDRGSGQPADGKMHFTMSGGVMRPLSRGYVHINSADPSIPPTIDPRFLAAEYDRQLFVSTLDFSKKAVQQPQLAAIVQKQVSPALNLTRNALLEYGKTVLSAGAHITGTAAMAPRNLSGVVDTNLKVYGFENLRIADCSIFPMQLAAHPQATVYALAEKLADIIKLTK